MPSIEKIIKLLQDFAPENNTMTGYTDNVGLLLGRRENQTSRVLCCLDVTASVIEEAASINAGLIISHHPFMRTPLNRITGDTVMGNKILLASQNQIAIYSAHTNLDATTDGINQYVARIIGLNDAEVMMPTIEGEGIGRVGSLNPISLAQLSAFVKNTFDCPVRVVPSNQDIINKVAIINGGGGGIPEIELALAMGAQCLITADIKYHSALYASELGLALIEPTHYAMEHIYINELVKILKSHASRAGIAVDFFASKTEKSPYLG